MKLPNFLSLFNKFSLTSYNFYFFSIIFACFCYLYAIFCIICLFHIEVESVALMALGDVGNLKSLQEMRFEIIDVKEVENMFDVFHGVDMTIHIDIIIIGVDRAHQLRLLPHLHSGACRYRAFLLCLDILSDKSVIDGKISTGCRVSVSIIAQTLLP